MDDPAGQPPAGTPGGTTMMKRLAIVASVILGLAMLASPAQAAGSTNVVTNALGQVITTVVNEYGLRTTTIVEPNLPTSLSRTQISLVGIQLDLGAVTSTTNTLYTPRDIGDILIGKTLGTGAVWMATGGTTNDWNRISW